MSTTTQITSGAGAYLTGHLNDTLDLDGYAGEHASAFDMEAANAEYREAVEAALATYRPTWTIAGDFIYSPIEDADHLTEDEARDLRDDLDAIDAGAILSRHEVSAR